MCDEEENDQSAGTFKVKGHIVPSGAETTVYPASAKVAKHLEQVEQEKKAKAEESLAVIDRAAKSLVDELAKEYRKRMVPRGSITKRIREPLTSIMLSEEDEAEDHEFHSAVLNRCKELLEAQGFDVTVVEDSFEITASR